MANKKDDRAAVTEAARPAAPVAEWLSDADISKLLGGEPPISKATIRWWRLTGRLRFYTIGRHPRVRRSDLDEFLATCVADVGKHESK